MAQDVRELLGSEGPFARDVPGFAPRASQQDMAAAVAEAIDERHILIAEAGTGTGKTFAYLVPAVLSGKRVIVSTGTKTLQDQLFHRDLPRVRQVTGARIKAALLKGRANYLCLYRLDQTYKDGRLSSREQVAQVQALRAWASRSSSGDRNEIAEVPEESPLWPRVTSTAENCLGADCPMFNDCFVVKARRAAQEADLVVVNHHLLFADLAIKQEGFGEILPGANAFILDEAHQIPDLAGQFFSVTFSSRQLQELGNDAEAECGTVTGAFAVLREPIAATGSAIRRTRLALDKLPARGAFTAIEDDRFALSELRELQDALRALEAALGTQAERSRGLTTLHERAQGLIEKLDQVLDGSGHQWVHWYELSSQGFSLHATPLDLAPPLRNLRIQSRAAWILTSATLSVAGEFAHFSRQLGLDDPVTLSLPSPFDYPRQAGLWLADQVGSVAAPDFPNRVARRVWPLVERNGGRAFVLCTTLRAVRMASRCAERAGSPECMLVTRRRCRA